MEQQMREDARTWNEAQGRLPVAPARVREAQSSKKSVFGLIKERCLMMNRDGSWWRRVALGLSSLLFVGLAGACNPIVSAPVSARAPTQAATKPAAPAVWLRLG